MLQAKITIQRCYGSTTNCLFLTLFLSDTVKKCNFVQLRSNGVFIVLSKHLDFSME